MTTWPQECAMALSTEVKSSELFNLSRIINTMLERHTPPQLIQKEGAKILPVIRLEISTRMMLTMIISLTPSSLMVISDMILARPILSKPKKIGPMKMDSTTLKVMAMADNKAR